MAQSYPGSGKTLFLGYSPGAFPASPSAETHVYPINNTIANGSYSIAEPVNDAQNISVKVVFASAPGAIASVDVEYGSDPKLLDAVLLDQIVPTATGTMAGWQTSQPLNGFLRFKNTSGVNITSVVIQKQVASVG